MQPEKDQKPSNKYITDLLQFQQFFQDSRNDVIIKTIKKICLVGVTIEKETTGAMFAYRAGRQDVWSEIQKLVDTDIKQEKQTLEQMENENG